MAAFMIPWSLSSASGSGGRGAGEAYCTTSISAAPARKTAQVRCAPSSPQSASCSVRWTANGSISSSSKAPPKYRRAVSRSATDAVTYPSAGPGPANPEVASMISTIAAAPGSRKHTRRPPSTVIGGVSVASRAPCSRPTARSKSSTTTPKRTQPRSHGRHEGRRGRWAGHVWWNSSSWTNSCRPTSHHIMQRVSSPVGSSWMRAASAPQRARPPASAKPRTSTKVRRVPGRSAVHNATWARLAMLDLPRHTGRAELPRPRDEPVERVGVGQSAAVDAARVDAAEELLDGDLHLLARVRHRDGGHGDDVVGHVAGRGVRADPGRDARAQLVVEVSALLDHDEQREPVPARGEVDADPEAVADHRLRLQSTVDLRGAEADARPVQGGIGAAEHLARAVRPQGDPVAVRPGTRELFEVGGAVARPVPVGPEPHGHRGHRRGDHESPARVAHGLPVLVEPVRGDAEQRSLHPPQPHGLGGVAADERRADVGPAAG